MTPQRIALPVFSGFGHLLAAKMVPCRKMVKRVVVDGFALGIDYGYPDIRLRQEVFEMYGIHIGTSCQFIPYIPVYQL